MMKKLLLSVSFFAVLSLQQSQAQTAEQLHATGKNFLMAGDYANASLVLTRSLSMRPNDIETIKDLAQSYYFSGNSEKAKEIIKPALDDPNTDDQCYQIAGNIYKQLGDTKECEKLYKKGLKKFPKSGPLYNELGELQVVDQDHTDIKSWEKGIEADPSYSRNYYNAARYYFYSPPDIAWSILYGEIFVNMEPNGRNTAEIKEMIGEAYKKIFTTAAVPVKTRSTDFMNAYMMLMNQQSVLATGGINVQSLTAIRSKFIAQWFAVPGRPAFRLFDHQQQLINDGMFEAYNQWLFGPSENLKAYTDWIRMHKTESDAFENYRKTKLFKIPEGQYYH